MSDSPQPAEAADKGRHYAFIESAVSAPFKTATLSRSLALAATPLKREPWYSAPGTYASRLAAANLKAWDSQNKVDHLLARTDLYAFAEPLLKARIKQCHGIEPDVRKTWLRLYIPASSPWYAIDVVDGSTTRTVSLLDAALHNFAANETVGAGSDYISQPDARGHFDVLPLKNQMPISQFQTLCRDLDLGGQYARHLQGYLLPGEALAESLLQYKIGTSLKDALAVAAHIALLKAEIQYDTFRMVLSFSTEENPRLRLNNRSIRCNDLSMLGTRLTGILLLMHGHPDSRGVRRLIVYVPHDPDHPLKEYESLAAFRDELTRQLREDRLSASTGHTYRQFFSQFVDQQQRGHFFAELEQRLFVVRHHEREQSTDQRPVWRKDPVEKPRLQFTRLPLQGDYWRHVYQQKLNKIINDARQIAVSTADADSNARWAWWDNFKRIVSDIFNVALLIATPFVPGLGEVMMAYTAYQLTSDVIEGIVDLAEGVWEEAAGHVISVVTDVIQLAAFGAGAQIGETLRIKLSPQVDAMQQVKLPDGKPSLWHRDLSPYARDELSLAAQSKPDRHGLHQHASASVLPLEGKLYVVEKASADATSKTHRIKHPNRENAYQPRIEHNGHGAWLHEAESPGDWPDARLMPRLGHSVERFTPVQLEDIRRSSGTSHDELRRMHSDNSPPPPLLADTVRRVSAYEDVIEAVQNLRNGKPIDADAVWLEPMLTSLPGWPPRRALEVFARQDLTGYSHKYGNPLASEADTLRISQADLNAGHLPERVAGFLRDDEFNHLLGPMVTAEQRVEVLRSQLADALNQQRSAVARHLYQAGQRNGHADIAVIRQSFPDLPLPLAETVLSQARVAERQRISDEQHLPLRLKNQARELDFEASASRAYDGFYRDDLMTEQTERLALNTLKIHTDTFADLRIEVFDGSPHGPLRCSVGPQDASTVRQLLRRGEGRYEVRDAKGQLLHDSSDFHEAILRAVPLETLASTGYQRGQGRALKLWIMEQCAPPAERRIALAQPPIRTVAPRETEILLRGWPWAAKTPEQRLRQLYPKLNDREVAGFLMTLEKKGNSERAIADLEREREVLDNALDSWRSSYTPVIEDNGELIALPTDFVREGGLYIEQQLRKCFKRENERPGARNPHPEHGYTLDLSAELPLPNLESWWRDLRRRPGMQQYFDRITGLNITNVALSTTPDSLLASFPNLRQLSAQRCGFKEVPAALGKMHQLQTLDLSHNSIELTYDSSTRLSNLTRLHSLNLNGNNLRVPPDIGRMEQLVELNLVNTRIRDWPAGWLEVDGQIRQRPKGFYLDMRDNPLDTLPRVEPGSDQARLLARARISVAKFDGDQLRRLGEYRQSVGLSVVPGYSSAAADELDYWKLMPANADPSHPSAAFSRYREQSWHDLMAEPDSAGFFSVIRKQRESADYGTDAGRRNLTARVWDMVDAAALDEHLRKKLFEQNVSAQDCADLGQQLFNSLGLKVLVSKAWNETASAPQLEDRLVRLARSAARLDRVSDEAAMEVSRQQQQHLIDPRLPAPDEIQIHRAFEAGLGERLDLPWQAEGMPVQPRAGVTEEKLNAAYQRIIQREQGDGLVNGMIDLYTDPFWEDYLRNTYPDRYQENLRLYEEKFRQLDSQVFSSDREYRKLADKISYERNELSRALSREALDRAGL
ncbi:dermonecrotic toxin domain-containing protein [Pseudomonas sp. H1_G08]